MKRLALLWVLVLCTVPALRAQEPSPSPSPAPEPEQTIETETEAGAADAWESPRRRKMVSWNEYDGPISTLRFGGGVLFDFATYSQDAASEAQLDMPADVGWRDVRILFRGRFKTKRPITWSFGYMYDGVEKDWLVRQSGIQVGFPEIGGNLFIGRTKEGFSMVKVMVGYHGWGMERPTMLDFIPILADGLKWSGYHPKAHVFYNVGLYGDELSESQKFSTYDHQSVIRFGGLPILSEEKKSVLEVAVQARYAQPDEHQLRVRARPEANLAPYALDTGKFPADRTVLAGVEAYYRRGPLLAGFEYDRMRVGTPGGEEPELWGYAAVVSWLITGETRPYNAAGGYFTGVSPDRPVFAHGLGAWEAVLHFSYSDFDSGTIQGGKFWKLTPMMNWHMSDNIRLEFGYGYGLLDRFELQGRTQFWQARVQMTL